MANEQPKTRWPIYKLSDDNVYEVQKLIRTLETANLYLVKRSKDKKLFTLKTRKYAANFFDDKALPGFMSEATLARKLNHPNLIKIHFGNMFNSADNNLGYLLMEYVEGHTLPEHLMRGYTCSKEKKIDWMIEICEAIEYLHDFNLVYRDLKPEKILVNSSGSIKLFEFDTLLWPNDRLSDSSVFTEKFAAPEVTSTIASKYKKTDFSKSSDIYSLALIFHYILTLQLPSAKMMERRSHIIQQHKHCYYDARLFRLIYAMLAFNPHRRPSIARVKERLKYIRDNKTTRFSEWLAKWKKRLLI